MMDGLLLKWMLGEAETTESDIAPPSSSIIDLRDFFLSFFDSVMASFAGAAGRGEDGTATSLLGAGTESSPWDAS